MENIHIISPEHLSISRINEIITNNYTLALSEQSEALINKCRLYLDNKMKTQTEPIYGINTGFGSLYNKHINKEDLSKLQSNLVKSHACGTGDKVPIPIVKLMLLHKIHALALGHSGIQLKTVKRLIDFFNNDTIPVVYEQGSLGASGDLAPLAHLCLPLLGEGEMHYKGEIVSTHVVLKEMNWDVLTLQSKEGLALLNGTQFMSSYGVYNIIKAQKLSVWSDKIAALSLDAYDGRIEPFHHLIQTIRPHNGQIVTAENFRKYLKGSEIITRKKAHVQDPYSFRCIPQVHGATKDALNYIESVIETEVNSVTDNPTVFPDEDLIISAGNFHGQPLALVLDQMAIAMSELGNISERRTYQLISGKRELPSFLVAKPGLNSGFMIPQYAAASIASQNKQLSCPASVDSIESSQGQEDHVSMGANAATKALRVLDNTERILAIELLNAAQAMDFRKPLKTSPILSELMTAYREKVSFVDDDQIMYVKIKQSVEFLANN